jgi:hypothetical protein
MVGTFDALVARGHAQPGELYCFLDEFARWVDGGGAVGGFPVPAETLPAALVEWSNSAHALALVGFLWHGDRRSAHRPRARRRPRRSMARLPPAAPASAY